MANHIEKHFVEFYSPGTFVSEVTSKPIDSWDPIAAMEMAHAISERHGATPYGFRFITRSRGPDDLDSSVSKRSNLYYLGGRIRTLEEVESDDLPDERILRSNMRNNGYKRIIENTNSWKFTGALDDDDIVLDFTPRNRVAES